MTPDFGVFRKRAPAGKARLMRRSGLEIVRPGPKKEGLAAMTQEGEGVRLPAGSVEAGARLHFKRWRPEGEAKASVLLAHGYAEHIGRYQHVAAALNAAGYDVFAVDHWGHGRSDGARGFVQDFSVYLDGVDALHAASSAAAPDRKRFLIGHSMGGLVAASYLIRRGGDFAGAVLSGPLLKAPDEPPAPVKFIGKVLSRIAPKVGLISLDASLVSRDPKVVAAYVGDPLVYRGKITARLGDEMLTTMEETLARAGEIAVPILVLHGEKDGLASPEGSKLLHERMKADDKTYKVYDGFYHEIFNDPGNEGVISDVVAWLDQRA